MAAKIERVCKLTRKPFFISQSEVDAYASFQLPLPDLCPEERHRRLLAFRNERKFFIRTCNETNQKIFSTFAPNVPFPVVALPYWWNGEWDALRFGREFDFTRNFFEQLYDLWKVVPRPACSILDVTEARAVQNVVDAKHCFLVFDSYHVDHCYYSVATWDSSRSVDGYLLYSCNYCYECVDCLDCSYLRWSQHCISCTDSWFLFNCKDCKNCLFCANLEGKEYYVFNKEVSKEEYQQILESWTFTRRQRVEEAQSRFSEFIKSHPVPHIYTDNFQGQTGNYIYRCSDVIQSFESKDCTSIKHCSSLTRAHDCLDGHGFGDGLRHAAQFVSVGRDAHNLINCVECWNSVSNLTYCGYCEKSSNLFGCIGLRNKQFCVFNKQYSEKEYHLLVKKITEYMKSEQIWGAFFPPIFSGYAYNHSSAFDRMPLSKVQADLMQFVWDDVDDVQKPSDLIKVLSGESGAHIGDVPSRLEDIEPGKIGSTVYLCEITGKLFQYTREEIEFYRMVGVAPPVRCFEQRHSERLSRLSPRFLNMRKVDPSGREVETAFSGSWRQTVMSYEDWRLEVEENSR